MKNASPAGQFTGRVLDIYPSVYKARVLPVEPPYMVGQTEEDLVFGVNSFDQLTDKSVFT